MKERGEKKREFSLLIEIKKNPKMYNNEDEE